jgi:hypothetical protein
MDSETFRNGNCNVRASKIGKTLKIGPASKYWKRVSKGVPLSNCLPFRRDAAGGWFRRAKMAIDQGQYRFTVKEYASGALFLAAEPAGDRLQHLGGDLGFDLEPSMSHGDAESLAALLNRHITSITLTGSGY